MLMLFTSGTLHKYSFPVDLEKELQFFNSIGGSGINASCLVKYQGKKYSNIVSAIIAESGENNEHF